MRKNNLLRLLTVSCFLSLALQPHQAAAQWPTFDISSIKEGIMTNIELVKQSKVITDAMATAGKINSAIGDAKASASKFVGDNLEKAQEKMKKLQEEKERIEKRKEEYEKIKKEIDEKKAKVEEYQRKVQEARAQAESYVDEAKGYVNDAKEMKDAASGLIDEAQSEIEQRTGSDGSSVPTPELDTPQAVNAPDMQAASSGRTAFGTPQAEEAMQALPPTSDAKDYGEQDVQTEVNAVPQEMTEEQLRIRSEMEALDQERAELEVDAMFAKTPEEKAAVEEKMKALDEKYKELENQLEETSNKPEEEKEGDSEDKAKEESEEDKAKEESEEDKKDQEQPLHRPKILDGETSTKMEIPEAHRPKILDGETSTQMEIPESHRPKILDTYQAPKDHRPKILDLYEQQRSQSSSGGFRKRATPKTSAIEGKHYASRSFSETIVFADLTGGDVPDGTVNGVFIFSDRLAQECEVNVKDLEDESVMDECIKKLVKAKSDQDASIAQDANAVYRTIMQETVNALIAESMARKNEAANYETEVLEKVEEQIANTKNTRDDTSGLSVTNMETQYLLNRILSIYSAQLSVDALNAVGSFDKSYYQDSAEESGE